MARRRMGSLPPGSTLVVLATDPEAPIDLAAWAAQEGHAFAERPGEQTAWSEYSIVKRSP
jgi:TusA-related sulfurtransferase